MTSTLIAVVRLFCVLGSIGVCFLELFFYFSFHDRDRRSNECLISVHKPCLNLMMMMVQGQDLVLFYTQSNVQTHFLTTFGRLVTLNWMFLLYFNHCWWIERILLKQHIRPRVRSIYSFYRKNEICIELLSHVSHW